MMGKPDVAFANEEAGRANIERKIKRLTTMLGESTLTGDAPKSLNQFNAWSYESGSADESFAGNAHETLTKHETLKAEAFKLTRLAKNWAKPAPPARELSVRRAREQAGLHLNLRQIAERHALDVMLENRDLRSEIEALRSTIDSMTDELTVIRNGYEAALQEARSRNAELVRSTPSNIKVLRKDV